MHGVAFLVAMNTQSFRSLYFRAPEPLGCLWQ